MKNKKQQGVALITIMVIVGTLSVLGVALLSLVDTNLADSTVQGEEAQALYLAESGAADAVWYLENINKNWTGTGSTEHRLNNGSYVITVNQSTAPNVIIEVTAYIPNKANQRVHKTIRVSGRLN